MNIKLTRAEAAIVVWALSELSDAFMEHSEADEYRHVCNTIKGRLLVIDPMIEVPSIKRGRSQ